MLNGGGNKPIVFTILHALGYFLVLFFLELSKEKYCLSKEVSENLEGEIHRNMIYHYVIRRQEPAIK